MKYQETIKGILENIGGEANIEAVTHCMTRLRFTLKDDSKASMDGMKKVKGGKAFLPLRSAWLPLVSG